MDNKLVEKNVFAFYLTSGSGNSELTLGYYDPAKADGEIGWHSVEY